LAWTDAAVSAIATATTEISIFFTAFLLGVKWLMNPYYI